MSEGSIDDVPTPYSHMGLQVKLDTQRSVIINEFTYVSLVTMGYVGKGQEQ